MSERLTPVDILNMRFRRRWRGYAIAEVDEFVRKAASEMEKVLADNATMKERVGAIERELAQYRALEATMKDALILAQKAADETRAAAHAQAEAKYHETEAHVQQVATHILRLHEERRRFAREMHARMTAQLQWLSEEMETPEPVSNETPTVAPASVAPSATMFSTIVQSPSKGILPAVSEESIRS